MLKNARTCQKMLEDVRTCYKILENNTIYFRKHWKTLENAREC